MPAAPEALDGALDAIRKVPAVREAWIIKLLTAASVSSVRSRNIRSSRSHDEHEAIRA